MAVIVSDNWIFLSFSRNFFCIFHYRVRFEAKSDERRVHFEGDNLTEKRHNILRCGCCCWFRLKSQHVDRTVKVLFQLWICVKGDHARVFVCIFGVENRNKVLFFYFESQIIEQMFVLLNIPINHALPNRNRHFWFEFWRSTGIAGKESVWLAVSRY